MTKFVLTIDDDKNQRQRLKQALETLSGEVSRPAGGCSDFRGFQNLIGSSKAIAQAIELARKAAGSDITILLEGESGVGKEVFARAIQSESPRRDRPFVVVNCGAIPENLVESILFGHEKGAFTGATEAHPGKFMEANGGTLFLDEIGDLPLSLQVKLLRVLQEGEILPVGGTRPVSVDVRLISVTNQKLKTMVEENRFREDLFYRLNIFPIRLPPLRKRKDDIDALVSWFIDNISRTEGCPVKKITPEARALLRAYHWPGNVRQLENTLFRAIILSESDQITPKDFPQINLKQDRRKTRIPDRRRPESGHETQKPGQKLGQRSGMWGQDPVFDLSITDEQGHIHSIAAIEKTMLVYALDKYKGNMSEIAQRLGLGRSTVYRKIHEFGLDDKSAQGEA